jgi:hypothetical protein
MLRILLVMEEEDKTFLYYSSFNFPCSESLYLARKTF